MFNLPPAWRVTGKLTKVSLINLPPTFCVAILRQKNMTLYSGLSDTYYLIRFYFLHSKTLWEKCHSVLISKHWFFWESDMVRLMACRYMKVSFIAGQILRNFIHM